jgi:hypothetical protein
MASELREVGLALLEEGLEGFHRLRALQAAAEHLAFGADGGQRQLALRCPQQLLGLAHGARRQRVEALGHAACVVHHLAGRDHRVGDAELHRLLGREGVAGEQQLRGAAVPDQLRHHQAAGELGHQAQRHEGHRQPRLVAHVDKVAVQQHGRADADGRAGDGRHHGLVAVEQRAHEAEHRRVHRLAALAGRALHEVLDVVAAGEDAGLAGDQHGAHGLVLARGGERVGHGLVHGLRERVLLLGARDLDRGHAVEDGGLDAHGALVSFWFRPHGPARSSGWPGA